MNEIPRDVDQRNLSLFIHRRAFSKIGWRVMNFNSLWTYSPFSCLAENISDIVIPHNQVTEFKFGINPAQGELFHQYGIIPKIQFGTIDVLPTYIVSSATVENWLRLFEGVFGSLRDHLLHQEPAQNYRRRAKYQVRNDVPDATRTALICVYMSILHDARPVLQHILTYASDVLLAKIGLNGEFNTGIQTV